MKTLQIAEDIPLAVSAERKEPQDKRLHGTPQVYLPFVAGVGFATSPVVNSWLKGRP